MCRLKPALPPLLLALAACAQPGSPPGGPADRLAPLLLGTTPDSVVVLENFEGWVEFHFDEVISEGSAHFCDGRSPVEQKIVISPDTLPPCFKWQRKNLLVRPKNGWRANTTYRIELAPGIADLSGNATKESSVITFSTGGVRPTRTVTGSAVDWQGRSFLPGALIEAITLPDSLIYRAIADSVGQFTFGPLPAGPMLVRVTADRNGDHRMNYREPWDTVRLAPGLGDAGEVWVFPRDTTPAKFVSATRIDSITIRVQLDLPIDPIMALLPEGMRVILVPGKPAPDSASLAPVSAVTQAWFDSLLKMRATPTVDTTPPVVTQQQGNTTVIRNTPKGNRPQLSTAMVIQTRGRFLPDSTYKVYLFGIRTLQGVVGNVIGTFKVPPAPTLPGATTPPGRGGGGG